MLLTGKELTLETHGDKLNSAPIQDGNLIYLMGVKHLYIIDRATEKVSIVKQSGQTCAEDIARKHYWDNDHEINTKKYSY